MIAIEVLNTVGQVIYSAKTNSNTTTVNLNGVARGSYIVKLTNGTTSTQKMFIVK